MSVPAALIAASPILIEDGLQIAAQIIQAIQQAQAKGATTIDPSVLIADKAARDAALKKLDDDLAAGH
jgi:hypothetical protein